jgi:hypothetical protein
MSARIINLESEVNSLRHIFLSDEVVLVICEIDNGHFDVL